MIVVYPSYRYCVICPCGYSTAIRAGGAFDQTMITIATEVDDHYKGRHRMVPASNPPVRWVACTETLSCFLGLVVTNYTMEPNTIKALFFLGFARSGKEVKTALRGLLVK